MTRRPVFPRLPLIGLFTLVGMAVVGAYAGRVTHAGAAAPGGTIVSERDLLFADRADGAVVAMSAADRKPIEVFEGQQGFLRGTLRGIARTRHLTGLGAELPFRLARWSDGRLTLDDPATGEHVELLAFGPTNAAVFAPLLEAAP